MVRRLALHALSQGAARRSVAAAEAALAGHDPLARWLARRRVAAALRRADQLTVVEDEALRCRIAACVVLRKLPEADYDDQEAIAAEVDPLLAEVAAPGKRPLLTLATMSLLVLAVVAPPAIWLWLRPFEPRRLPVGAILGDDVPSYLVAMLNGQAEARDEARAEATGREAGKALGADGATALGEVLDAAQAVRQASDEELKERAQRYTAKATAFNDALQRGGHPFFLDADIWTVGGRVTPVLLSFYVERESEARSGDERVRALRLWRLDTLNLTQHYLGYTRRDTPAALVLLDQIESQLVRFVLPALAAGEPMWLVDEKTRGKAPAWATELGVAAAETVRRLHLDPASSVFDEPTRQALTRVGALLARRRALVISWRDSMAEHRRRLRIPTRLIPRGAYSDDLHLFVPTSELVEWDELHDELLERDNLAAFVAIREHYTDATERHEIQHRLDYGVAGGLKMPDTIAKRLGVDPDDDLDPRTRPARARDELSAYLASLAQSRLAPQVGLIVLQSFVFDAQAAGGPYSYAALAALEGIARELGIDVDAVLGKRLVERAAVAQLLMMVTARDEAELRKAAAAAYERAFGRSLPEVEVDIRSDNPAWRH